MRLPAALRRVSALSRLAVAFIALAAIGFGVVNVSSRAEKSTENRRAADWLLFTRTLAEPLTQWFSAGLTESAQLADQASQASIDSYLANPHGFGRSAVVTDAGGRRILAASRDLGALSGREPELCQQGDTADSGLPSIAAAAAAGRPSSRVLTVPGHCRTSFVAFASAKGPKVVVLLAPLSDIALHLSVNTLVTVDNAGGRRIFVVSPAGESIELPGTPDQAGTTPQRVTDFVARSPEPHVGRYERGASGTEIVGAAVAVGAGWNVVLEQDAAIFDPTAAQRPTGFIALALIAAFAVVLLILVAFDVRRTRALRRAEVAKNAFFSVAGHELRTPLTSLKGFTETLVARWDDVDDERKRGLAERMLPQAMRLERLVDRLLTGASMQAQTHTHPQVHPVDVTKALNAVCSAFEVQAPLHTFVVDAEVPTMVMGDDRALQQVFTQLVDNAVKYSPKGGLVKIMAKTTKKATLITVDDEGVGLPSDMDKIFEALAQGESVTKRVHDEGGMGLGLYIARTLLREMGGDIRAERLPNGSRFKIRLRSAQTPNS